MTRRRWIVLLTLAAATLLPWPAPASDAALSVATWSGVYGAAQEAALFKPFTRATGIGVRIHRYDGDLGPLTEDGNAGRWDIVDIEHGPLTVGCAEGTFRRIDANALLGKASVPDFLAGTLHPCGVGSLIWSQAVAYDPAAFKNRAPWALADFFDLQGFPGKRGLFTGPEGNLEIALMADGVPPADVYDILRRPGGVERALAKLETIRPAAVFWHDGTEPERLLNEGTVSMTTAYAGRFQRPRQGARRPAALLWANQIWRVAYWAIPAKGANATDAERFLTFATDPVRLGELATRLWFGPARKTGFDAVPPNMRQDLPTSRANFNGALRFDAGFWSEFGAEIRDRFIVWRRG